MPVTSAPASTTRPPDGRRSPQITSNRVLLPAPLGPISPVTRPGPAVSPTPSRTRFPPNATVTPLTSSDPTGQHLLVLRPPGSPHAPPLDRDLGGSRPPRHPGRGQGRYRQREGQGHEEERPSVEHMRQAQHPGHRQAAEQHGQGDRVPADR